ncbi:allene oxide synthase-lipoxygenase protein isoform X1 [Octopus sinensis]|uniref:Allene oxide synthase-lipoxygenase protein isoform X1 n=1 Tax=Octopus sinensis TaxID=2607531 RepID=A0A6P7TAX3_9MOLL|nr:allene oxide synthase-lipoxygenase protein isoform X1 [Octopus sinensis]XP_036366947.1 allene oxide synthase-lipoxygenase protein isoform X1 [Octopus sinensis]
MGLMQSSHNITLRIRTGDQKGAATDANVYVILYDTSDNTSEKILVDNFWKNDFKIGALDTFNIQLPESFTEVKKIELWTEQSSVELTSSTWFIQTVELVRGLTRKSVTFPVFRWIRPSVHYSLYPWDTFLPQNDPDKEQRENEIKYKREIYKLKYQEGSPATLESLPGDEEFSYEYQRHLLMTKWEGILKNWFTGITTDSWKKLDDLTNIYYKECITKPKVCSYWKEDTWFGYQRLNGCNPKSIKLCEEIPSKLGVDEEMMKPILKGETLEGLIQEKRLFYADLEILEGIGHKEGFDCCAPIALFMLNSENNLVPIAIQLQQQKGADNPVFLPTDDWGVWTLAKMWFNLADSSYHQSVVHLGLTHLLMEVVVLAQHRNMSVSHPVYKLLAPHTLFLLAINKLAFERLASPGGWIDKTMTIQSGGLVELFHKGLQRWDFYRDGIPANDFANRKVDDPKVLPNYYFRDDSLALYNSIYKYVSSYIDIYYVNENDISDDWEIQDWIKSMAVSHEDGGLQGLPMKDGIGHVSSKEELKWILAVIIFTCSVTHAAVNFLQYEEYGFPANYPSMLRTPLLKDKEPKTEKDIIDALPEKDQILDVLSVTHLLSSKGTNSLGYFETRYIYDPKALGCITNFQSDLKKIGEEIRKRNKTLHIPYEVLDPVNVPNAISI